MNNEMNNEVVEVKEESKKIDWKMVAIVGLVSGIFGYKAGKYVNSLKSVIEVQEKQIDILNAAASEGLYEEAIATVTRKLNYLKDRIAYLSKQLAETPNDTQTKKALETYTERLSVLTERKRSFQEAQKAYEVIVKE